jgi:streptomycin 6-kinase
VAERAPFPEIFDRWLERWNVVPDGDPISGPNSTLLPVRRGKRLLMLKAAMQPREVRAAGYLEWLDGNGAVSVLAREQDAMLMERAAGPRSLVGIDASGLPGEAYAILCDVAASLHRPRGTVPVEAMPLSAWLQRLNDVSSSSDFFERMAQKAAMLLDGKHDIAILHGDLHHWNVLDGECRGWLAIDPNGLVGDRTFDFALMVLPTNLKEDRTHAVLWSRAQMIARLAHLDADRLLSWTAVQAALWAAWDAPGRDWVAVSEAAHVR